MYNGIKTMAHNRREPMDDNADISENQRRGVLKKVVP